MSRSASQSQKWQLIGMSYNDTAADYAAIHPLSAAANNEARTLDATNTRPCAF